MPPSSQQCYPSNTDITGIGVRTSIYALATLSFIPTILSLAVGHITPTAHRIFTPISFSSAVVASAITISAIIQQIRFGLAPYDALVVLNLSWISSVGMIIWSFHSFVSQPHASGVLEFVRNHIFDRRLAWSLAPASTQLCMIGGLGIWVWARLIEDQSVCLPDTSTIVFGHPISPSNKGMRYISLIIYSIAAIPIINLLLFFLLYLLLTPFIVTLGLLLESHVAVFRNPNKTLYIFGGLCGAFLDVLFATDTELITRRNRTKDADWSFGQTLVVVLLIPPVIGVCKELLVWCRIRKGDSAEPVIECGKRTNTFDTIVAV